MLSRPSVRGSNGDAARRTPISGEEQKRTGGCKYYEEAGHNRDGKSETGAASGGSWPGPCESDPKQRGLETLEVFVEGTRSRDRRFLAPKTGLMRALQVLLFPRTLVVGCVAHYLHAKRLR